MYLRIKKSEEPKEVPSISLSSGVEVKRGKTTF